MTYERQFFVSPSQPGETFIVAKIPNANLDTQRPHLYTMLRWSDFVGHAARVGDEDIDPAYRMP